MIAVFYALVAGGTALGAVILGILMEALGVKDSLVVYGIAVCLYGVWSFVRFAKSHAPVARQDSELR
jgi:predicted MFS family arabinose efflux permease